MLRSLKTNFLFLTCLIFLCYHSNALLIRCNTANRPNQTDCLNQTRASACGYYTRNCPLVVCGINAYNRCDACSNDDILYTKEGECEPGDLVQTCSNDTCNLEVDPKQPFVYEPVCGVKRVEKQGVVGTTFDNVCQVCGSGDYIYYQTGVCQNDRNYCREDPNCDSDDQDDNSNEEGGKEEEGATEQDEPVCAYLTTDDVGSVYTTVASAAEACSDEAVEFWTKGACGDLRDNSTYCLPNTRPEMCTEEYDPVCGFYKDEDGNIAYKVMGNACAACAATEILYHQPGPCVFYCDLNPNVIYDCTGNVEPVCGTYEEDGEQRNVSLRNGCIGCYYSGRPIVSYTDGLCPGDEGIQCANDAGAFQEGFLHPVCAYSSEECDNDSCRQTYAEPILACGNSSTVWYSLEACPGDQGVSCDDYRTRPEDPPTVYEDVCGFTSENCTDASCWQDYSDQYGACGESNVLSFTNGPCA